MEMLSRDKFAILNVVEDEKAFARIEKGEQKVVFAYFERKRVIYKWYAKSESQDKCLVIKVWQRSIKKGNKSLLFKCDFILDSDNWILCGWLPTEERFAKIYEPGEDYFILYLGERVKIGKTNEQN